MFSGIIEEAAVVRSLDRGSDPLRLVVTSSLDQSDTKVGDSVAIDGVCLTVVEHRGNELHFQLLEETMRRSALGALGAGDRVNLERSLRVGGRLHGHFVFGHVDATSRLVARTPDGSCDRYAFALPTSCRGFVVAKGSIAISGISLTVGEVSESEFSVYIIPHTASVTNLGALRPGDTVNIEIDMLARYVHSLSQHHPQSAPGSAAAAACGED